MTASINDLFTKASNGTAPVATTLASQKNNGANTASLSLATGWPTTTGVHGLLYKVDANNAYVPGSLLVWKATLSGTTLSNFTIKSGTDDVYPAGSVIELAPTSAWADDIATGMLVDHGQSGYHSDLHDANGNVWIKQVATASAVNYAKWANAIAGKGPTLSPDGSDTDIDLNINSKGAGVIKLNGAAPKPFIQNATFNFIESGCVWTADAAGSTKAASMTAGVVWIAGKRLTVAAVTARTFTASKDTYVDFQDNGDGTATVIYTEVTNNAASPAIPNSLTDADNIRDGIVVTGASNIAAASSINQGQEDRVLPIASSIPYSVTDSLGNLICPRDPLRKLLGYRQILANATATTIAQITGLTCPVIVPTGRKIKITLHAGAAFNVTAGGTIDISIWDGVVNSGTQLAESVGKDSSTNGEQPVIARAITTPSSSSKTYNAGMKASAGTANLFAASTAPVFIMVELS